MNDARVIRDRHEAVDAEIDRSQAAPPDGSRTQLVTTTTYETYPTTAQAYFAVVATGVTGAETEGATPSLSQESQIFYAANLGSAVPPNGTPVKIYMADGGSWVFRYDG